MNWYHPETFDVKENDIDDLQYALAQTIKENLDFMITTPLLCNEDGNLLTLGVFSHPKTDEKRVKFKIQIEKIENENS